MALLKKRRLQFYYVFSNINYYILQQISSDEEEATTPTFDRSTKPAKMAPSSDMHHRDFQPVWGDVVSNICLCFYTFRCGNLMGDRAYPPGCLLIKIYSKLIHTHK